MKGIILAGGTGSRLLPLTKVTNKHLLPVGRIPMVEHCVNKLVSAKIKDIMIVTGTEHVGDMITHLGSGSEFGCNFTYRVQDVPDGIAGALLLCEDFVGNDSCAVLLGDNIFSENLENAIEKFKNINVKIPKCLLCLKHVDDPTRFGVPKFDNSGENIIKIFEKPKDPPSSYCITGIYLYDKNVFSYIRNLKKSSRGEYEITDVNNLYVDSGKVFSYTLEGWWTDAGTHDSYAQANNLLRGF
tara:strand:- start:8706 stop:9431 length:726 start_codon:yes stop_codon:yes gene_type:complete